jgi:hypothetical protein
VIEGDTKTWIEVELAGFTDELVAKIRSMAAEGALPAERQGAAPTVDETLRTPEVLRDGAADADERQLFTRLTADLRRMRQASVNEVLGLRAGRVGADDVRSAWMKMVRRFHPDLVARHAAPAISHLAEELTILCNRAYDRLRAQLVAEGRAVAIGAVLRPQGWIVGLEDLDERNPANTTPTGSTTPRAQRPTSDVPPPPPAASAPEGADVFEQRARGKLAGGDATEAQEILAAALVVYPRSRPLRSLYYVAAAVAALGNGERMLAVSQLETALAHHGECSEAALMLDRLKGKDSPSLDDVRRIFAS